MSKRFLRGGFSAPPRPSGTALDASRHGGTPNGDDAASVVSGDAEAAASSNGKASQNSLRKTSTGTNLMGSFKSSFRLSGRLSKSVSAPHSIGSLADAAAASGESGSLSRGAASEDGFGSALDRSVRVGDWRILCSQFSTQGPRHANEDRMLFSADVHGDAGTEFQPEAPVSCFGVMDGHGGHECAQFCVDQLVYNLAGADCWQRDDLGVKEKLRAAVAYALDAAEETFLRHAVENADNSGACVVFGAFSCGHLCVANVGDCRAALHRSGTDTATAVELTVAHRSSNPEERRRIEASGGMLVNNRAFGVLEPSRTIGDWDVKSHCPGAVVADPHFAEVTLMRQAPGADGTCLVLGSDGVWDVVQTPLAIAAARKALKKLRKSAEKDPARALVRVALRNGTMDDATAMVLEFC
ncbi:unnamed protein product [Phaeothamnion confervicola]